MRRRGLYAALAALIWAAMLLAPAAALAAGAAKTSSGQSQLSTSTGPLGGGITQPATTPTTTTSSATVVNTSTSGGGGGISAGSAIGIAVAAFVIIGGIAVAIFRDARRRTRDRHAPSATGDRVPGSKRPPKARKLSPAERRRRKRGRAPRRK